MNIIEAVKTGLPIKREIWVRPDVYPNINCLNLSNEDILADDWITKKKQVEVTKGRLAEAWDMVVAENDDFCDADDSIAFDKFCRELGL